MNRRDYDQGEHVDEIIPPIAGTAIRCMISGRATTRSRYARRKVLN
jgi:hypothetical protein